MSVFSVTVRMSKVPKYLRKSELYLSFEPETDDEITVPKDCLKLDPLVKSAQDLDHLLRTMRFWVLSAFPDALITFLLAKRSDHDPVLRKYEMEFPNIRRLLREVQASHRHNACDIAARYDRADFLDFFSRKRRFGDVCDMNTLKIAAQNGHLECLKYAHQKLALGRNIHVDCLPFVKRNDIRAIKYLVEHGLKVDTVLCEKAAELGSLLVLTYLWSYFPTLCSNIGTVAAMHDQLECLVFALGRGCEVDDQLCHAAIAATGTRCLQYLTTTFPEVVLTDQLFTHTCGTGKLLHVQILHQHGCPVHPVKAVEAAAAGGSMQCLQFLSDLGFDCWLPSTMAAAARANHFLLTMELLYMGCPWDDSVVAAAVPESRCYWHLHYACVRPDQCKRPNQRCYSCDSYRNRVERTTTWGYYIGVERRKQIVEKQLALVKNSLCDIISAGAHGETAPARAGYQYCVFV